MMVCERCGSQNNKRTKTTLRCFECGYTRALTKDDKKIRKGCLWDM